MATFGLFVPSVDSTSVQYLFHTYIIGPSLPLNCSNFAKTANLPAMAPFLGPSWTVLATSGGPSCPILAPSWRPLGSSWPTSAPSCAIVAPSWAHLGSILAPSCPILAPSLSFLGHFLQQLLSSPSLSNFLSNFSLSAGGQPPSRYPPLSIGLLSRASGQEGSCLQFLASLSFFSFFLIVTFSDTQIKSPVRTVPRLCRWNPSAPVLVAGVLGRV